MYARPIMVLILFSTLGASAQNHYKSKRELYEELFYTHQVTKTSNHEAAQKDERTVTSSFQTAVSTGNNYWQSVWQPTGHISALTKNSLGVLFAGTYDEGIFTSTDNGETWAAMNSALYPTYDLEAAAGGTLYAGAHNGTLYRTTDNGINWYQTTLIGASGSINAVTTRPDGRIYAGTSCYFGLNPGGWRQYYPGEVLRSSDNGEHWSVFHVGLIDNEAEVCDVLVNANGDLYAGTSEGIFKSTNDGESWTQVNSGLTDIFIRVMSSNTLGHVFAATGSGIFRSTNAGETWSSVNTGLTNVNVFSLLPISSENILAGTAGGLFFSTNNGATWTEKNSGMSNTTIGWLQNNSDGYIFAVNNQMYRSSDSILIPPAIPENLSALAGNGQVQLAWNKNSEPTVTKYRVYFGTSSPAASLIDSTGSLSDTIKVIAGLSKGTYYFRITAVTDTYNESGYSNEAVSEVVLPVELSSFAIRTENLKTALRWTTATEVNNYGFEVERRMINESWNKIGFVAGYGTSSSPHEYIYYDSGMKPGRYVYRLKQIDNNGTSAYTQSVETEIKDIPAAFVLLQNFPNPFNPSTIVRYELPERSRVRVLIYDALGQVIQELVNTEQSAGIQSVAWHANVSSGLYLYRLEATSLENPNKRFIETMKMTVMK